MPNNTKDNRGGRSGRSRGSRSNHNRSSRRPRNDRPQEAAQATAVAEEPPPENNGEPREPGPDMHLAELQRLGAVVRRQGNAAVVSGSDRLSGAPVTASDLRASAALILAGLVAEGRTEVHRVYHIDRGYEAIEERLAALGADIWREKE